MLLGLFAACLPPVGTVMPLKGEIRAPSGVVVRVFSPERNDAEFRGCGDDGCRVMIHRRQRIADGWRTRTFDERGFGPVVVLSAEQLDALVELPACAPAPPEPVEENDPDPRPRPRRRRAERPFHLPTLDARIGPRLTPPSVEPAPDGPPVAELIARTAPDRVDHDPHPGLALVPPTPVGEAPARVGDGRFVAPDRRIKGRVHEDGRVEFDPPATIQPLDGPVVMHAHPWDRFAPMMGGVGGRGEGLNALDGADIYAPDKRKFLAETRARRYEMYTRRRAAALVDHRALYTACQAAMTQMEGQARRTRLFLLWDEVDPDPIPAARASADAARRYIETLIRERLPRKAGGYTLEELVELNLCRPAPLFDPYGDPELPERVAQRCE